MNLIIKTAYLSNFSSISKEIELTTTQIENLKGTPITDYINVYRAVLDIVCEDKCDGWDYWSAPVADYRRQATTAHNFYRDLKYVLCRSGYPVSICDGSLLAIREVIPQIQCLTVKAVVQSYLNAIDKFLSRLLEQEDINILLDFTVNINTITLDFGQYEHFNRELAKDEGDLNIEWWFKNSNLDDETLDMMYSEHKRRSSR